MSSKYLSLFSTYCPNNQITFFSEVNFCSSANLGSFLKEMNLQQLDKNMSKCFQIKQLFEFRWNLFASLPYHKQHENIELP